MYQWAPLQYPRMWYALKYRLVLIAKQIKSTLVYQSTIYKKSRYLKSNLKYTSSINPPISKTIKYFLFSQAFDEDPYPGFPYNDCNSKIELLTIEEIQDNKVHKSIFATTIPLGLPLPITNVYRSYGIDNRHQFHRLPSQSKVNQWLDK